MYTFQPVKNNHLQELADILNYYVLNSTVTFHKALLADNMREKVFFSMPIYGSFIVLADEKIAGYCTISPWKKQEAYRHTAEVSMYFKPEFTAKGIGGLSLKYLENIALKNDIKTLIAGVCSENIPSIKLFEKHNYTQCAHFKNVGYKFGRELDTIYLQKHL